MSEPIIICQNLSKLYQKPLAQLTARFFPPASQPSKPALSQINFVIHPGETIGIIGLNGSGKSTLLKLLAGVTKPDSGNVQVKGTVMPLIELGAGFNPELTGRENIYLNASLYGLDKKITKKQISDIIAFSELDKLIDQPIKTYSSGMYLRLAFAITVQIRPQIILLDEILAVGDLRFQQKCLRHLQILQSEGTTIIFVSHAINLIQTFCSRVLYLEKGKLKKDGPTAAVCDLYLQDLAQLPASSQDSSSTPFEPPWQTRLYSPTYVQKINSLYYLVDCWHHRILFNHNLIDKIQYWTSLSDHISFPHSLASDGKILVTENTNHHQLLIFSQPAHQLIQTLNLPGLRPHRVIYSETDNLFFCLCAQSQTFIILKKQKDQTLKVVTSQNLEWLKNRYTRSFSLIDGDFYFTASSDLCTADPSSFEYHPCQGQIIRAKLEQNSLDFKQMISVPDYLSNMNDIFYLAPYFYLTATPGQIYRTKKLSYLNPQSKNHHLIENLSDRLNLLGTPYYLSLIDHRLYIPEITSHSRLTSAKIISPDEIVDVKHQYDFGPPLPADIKKRFKKN